MDEAGRFAARVRGNGLGRTRRVLAIGARPDELAALRAEGFDVDAVLAAGNAADEIAKAATEEECDLIAMATHGHRGSGPRSGRREALVFRRAR